MTDESDVVFTADQVAACSTALRTALGHPPERFTAAKFVGMISDEIAEMRAKGWSDGEIAALVSESTGSILRADSIARHFVVAGQPGPV